MKVWTTVLALCLVAPAASAQEQTTSYRNALPGDVPQDSPWDVLEAPGLSSLVTEGLAGNRDLRSAAVRVVQAEAQAGQALSPILPTVLATAGVNLGPYETAQRKQMSFTLPDALAGLVGTGDGEDTEDPTVRWTGNVLLQASWSPDLFGQRIATHRAALDSVAAGRDDRDDFAALVGLQITSAWLDAVTAARQERILREQLGVIEELLQLVELRHEQGSTTALDVLQQRQQVASLRAALPGAAANVQVQQARLHTLLGRGPGSPALELPSELPPVPPLVGAGQPADLWDNRPDLRALADRREAAKARKHSAVANLLPSLSFSGNVGVSWWHDNEFDSLETWGVGASLTVPIFRGGGEWAAIRGAEAGLSSAGLSLDSTFLSAVEAVESGLARHREGLRALEARGAQLDAAQAAFDKSRERYLAGLEPYVTVLTAFNSLLQAQIARLQSHRALLGTQLGLRQALGGDWTRGLGKES